MKCTSMCSVPPGQTSTGTENTTTETLIKETIGGISKMTVTATVFAGIAGLMLASAIGAAILTAAIKLNREDASDALKTAFINQKVKAF